MNYVILEQDENCDTYITHVEGKNPEDALENYTILENGNLIILTEEAYKNLNKQKIHNGIYCCGKQLFGEDGVNDSLYFECEECGKAYNIVYSEVEE